MEHGQRLAKGKEMSHHVGELSWSDSVKKKSDSKIKGGDVVKEIN